ncbi:hypothetical protein Ancab_035022 [Ancistrocladus abbreviatus]
MIEWKSLPAAREKFFSRSPLFILYHNQQLCTGKWEDVLLDDNIRVAHRFCHLRRPFYSLQSRKGSVNNTKRLVSANDRTTLSSSDCYYLDTGHQPPATNRGNTGLYVMACSVEDMADYI